MTITTEEYYRSLRATDWDYNYSDSREARIRGQEEVARRAEESNASPIHAEMFEAFIYAARHDLEWPSLEKFQNLLVEDEDKNVSTLETVA